MVEIGFVHGLRFPNSLSYLSVLLPFAAFPPLLAPAGVLGALDPSFLNGTWQ